ncbi:putative E3 ubiquitin-protein ligase herc4 [Podochytrium sp. JEL0797]|nr:putative E3 ubiquitin-protein ligase herc4 [Podochytrium sp. JEL0797]
MDHLYNDALGLPDPSVYLGDPGEAPTHPHDISFFHDAEFSINSAAFGEAHGCAVVSLVLLVARRGEEGILLAWGDNSHGQVGHSKNNSQPSRVDTLDLFVIKQVSCGSRFSVVLTTCGKVLSFGSNEYGQLGHSFESKKSTKPKLVKFMPVPRITHALPKIVSIASGSRHSLLLSEDGSVWSFGDNSLFQLAFGRSVPVSHGAALIPELYGVPIKKIVCGGAFSMALTSSGTVYSWGSNTAGQLGHGSRVDTHVPTTISKLSGVVDICAGENHCIAIDSNGKCFVWGSGYHVSPIELTGMDGCAFGPVLKIASGKHHSFILAKRLVGDGSENHCFKVYILGRADVELGNSNMSGHSVGHVALAKVLDADKYRMYGGLGDQAFLVSSQDHDPADAAEGLTLTVVEELVHQIETDGSPSAGALLTSKLQQNLFSLSRLNSSFLSATHFVSDGFADPSVSLSDIQRAFSLLSSMKHSHWAPKVHKILCEAAVTSPLVYAPSSPSTPESLRGFLILLENPFLATNKENLESVRKLANVINDLTEDQKKVFEGWWRNNPKLLSNFKTAVASFNKALTLFTKKRLEDPTIAILEVMKWLWTISNRPCGNSDPLKFNYKEPTYTQVPDIPASTSGGVASSNTPSIPQPSAPASSEPSRRPSVQAFAIPTNANMTSMLSALSALGAHPSINIQLDPRSLPTNPNGAPPTAADIAALAAQAFTRQMDSLFSQSNEVCLGDRPSPVPLIPHADFVNETLSKRIDFANDFMMFYASTRPNVFGPGAANDGLANVFSFCRYPFSFSLGARTTLLVLDAQRQMMESQSRSLMRHLRGPSAAAAQGQMPGTETVHNLLKVRRKHLLHDSFKYVGAMIVANLKKPFKVKFVEEMGIDGGGVSREFMDLFFRRLLKHTDMFVDVEAAVGEGKRRKGCIWFNPLSKRSLASFRTVGRILGLAFFNSCLASLPFPQVLFKRLLGWPSNMADLGDLQPATAKWLKQMLEHEDASTFDECFYGLEFSVTVSMRRPDDKSVLPLVEPYKNVPLPGKFAGKPVTFANRNEYVRSMINWHTGGSVEAVLTEFRQGFLECCGGPILDQLLPQQLEVLLKGRSGESANFKDLETVAKYKKPYHKDHPVIKRFWSVFHALPTDFKYKFLMFMTGTDTIPPIRGLKEVQIVIQPSGAGATEAQAPTEAGVPSTTPTPNEGTAAAETANQNPTPNGQQPPQAPTNRFPGVPNIPGLPDLAALFAAGPPRPNAAAGGNATVSNLLNLPAGTSPRTALANLLNMFGPAAAATPGPGEAASAPAPQLFGDGMMDAIVNNAGGVGNGDGEEDGEFDDVEEDASLSDEESDFSVVDGFEGVHAHNHAAHEHEHDHGTPPLPQNPAGRQILGSFVFNLGETLGAGSSAAVGQTDGTAAMAVESPTGPIVAGEGSSSSSGGEAVEAPRGTKRGHEEELEDEVDDWEGDMSEMEEVQEDAKGKAPAFKKMRHGNSPAKKGVVQESSSGSVQDWKQAVVLDSTLNETVAMDGVDEQRLPVAHTCSFVLDLPAYQSVEQLFDRLVYAVENAGEFHLV